MDKTLQHHKLRDQPIGKLLLQMAVPTVLAQVVQLLYNIVDRIFVGHIPSEGILALAGLGVTFPIILLVSAFAVLVGMGGAPRAALAMGEGNTKKAEKLLGNSITLLVIFSILLTIILSLTKDHILLTFGASRETLPYASQYLQIYLFGTLFVQLALGLNMFITNQGFAKISMLAICIGCLLNIILDPILIFGFSMGVQGAAIATIISQGISALFIVGFLLSKKSLLKIRLKYLKLKGPIVTSILTLGLSAFTMQATECLVQLIFNKGMLVYGDDTYVALMSILFSLMQLIFLPIIGLAQGAQPILGYNYGANQMARVKKTFKLLFISCTTFSILMVSTILILPQHFLGLFTTDTAIIDLGIWPLRLFLFGMMFMGIQSACQQAFIAFGMAKISIFLALFRKVILLVPLALILPKFGLGVWGLFLAEPISDTIAAATTATIFKIKSLKMFATRPPKPLKNS